MTRDDKVKAIAVKVQEKVKYNMKKINEARKKLDIISGATMKNEKIFNSLLSSYEIDM